MGILAKLFGLEKGSKNEWQTAGGEVVRFKRKWAKPSLVTGVDTYEEWTAPTASAARAYLHTRTVLDQQYYIVVETPEGNWGKDRNGMYEE